MVTKKNILLLTLLMGFCAFALLRPVTASAVTHYCDSGDYYGALKEVFYVSDNVYFNGTGFPPSSTFNIYVVIDQNWTDGEPIPSRVPGTVKNVSSDASGIIPPTLIWKAPLTPGKYNIVLDVNNNGIYDKNIDCLDNNDVQVTAGFFVVPEYLFGTIIGVAGFFAAYGMYRLSKKRSLKPLP